MNTPQVTLFSCSALEDRAKRYTEDLIKLIFDQLGIPEEAILPPSQETTKYEYKGSAMSIKGLVDALQPGPVLHQHLFLEYLASTSNRIIPLPVGNRYAGKTWAMKCYQEAYRRALGKAFGTGGNSHDRRKRRRWMPSVLRPFRQQIKENKQPFFIGS